MNKVILMGRLTRDPDIRVSQSNEPLTIARFTLAVDRKKRDAEQNADFISCIAFGKTAEFVDRYLKQGTKIALEGRWQTGSYEKDGKKIYTNDCVADQLEFAESKKSSEPAQPQTGADGWMTDPEGIDEELPFT